MDDRNFNRVPELVPLLSGDSRRKSTAANRDLHRVVLAAEEEVQLLLRYLQAPHSDEDSRFNHMITFFENWSTVPAKNAVATVTNIIDLANSILRSNQKLFLVDYIFYC